MPNGKPLKADAIESALWYRKSAEKGNMQAQFLLAMLHYEGLGVRKSLQETRHWLELVASAGYSLAQDVLGDEVLLQDDAASKEDKAMAVQ